MCRIEDSFLNITLGNHFPTLITKRVLKKEFMNQPSPHYILTSLGKDLETLATESIPPPVFWPVPIF